jgi:hypothetical protein
MIAIIVMLQFFVLILVVCVRQLSIAQDHSGQSLPLVLFFLSPFTAPPGSNGLLIKLAVLT